MYLIKGGMVEQDIYADKLRKGDEVVVSAGELIPADGEVIEGVASVDESAITGESAPVIREPGGPNSAISHRTPSPDGLYNGSAPKWKISPFF